MGTTTALIAKALADTNQTSVVVYDFYSKQKLTALGVSLADSFSTGLTDSVNPPIRIVDRSQMVALAHSMELGRDDVEFSVSLGSLIAQQLDATAFLMGTLTPDGDQLDLSLSLFKVGEYKPMQTWKTTLALAPAWSPLLAVEIDDSPLHVPRMMPGLRPSCISCTAAKYTDAAKHNRTEGDVLLLAVIGADGKPTNIHVLGGLPDGLNDAALKAVSKWRFKPAKGSDGNPVAVRAVVEVTFRLF
jgi:TonB family protein